MEDSWYHSEVYFGVKFALRALLSAAALWVAAYFLAGFTIIPVSFPWFERISPLVQSLILGGIVLAFLNTFVRPILKFFSLPAIIFTLGLFNIVINLAVLWIADQLLAQLAIENFMALLIGSALIAIANII